MSSDRVAAPLVLALTAVLLIGGCLGSTEEPVSPTGDSRPTDGDDERVEGDEPGAGDEDEPASTEEPHDPGWPPLAEAEVRPGVPIRGESCTAAFILASPDNRSLYVTTAGHCYSGITVGENVTITSNVTGRLAFKVNVPRGDLGQDLALVAVHEEHRGAIHPAMRHYGGPAGMAEDVAAGDKVLTAGASSSRNPQGIGEGDRLDAREGYVRSSREDTTTIAFLPPSYEGDSGSPVTTAEGGAVGVLATGIITPTCPTLCSVIVDLEPKLEAAEEAGVPVELKTASESTSGRLP